MTTTATTELEALIDDVLAMRPGAAASPLHGEGHWQRVAITGMRLAEATRGADALVVLLFSVFHDSCRVHDGYDPLHGPRAARLAHQMLRPGGLLSAAQLGVLTFACERHDAGETSIDPTIGCAWDSDRLNLWRCGIEPDPHLLSTPAAREPATVAWARSLQAAEVGWGEVLRLWT